MNAETWVLPGLSAALRPKLQQCTAKSTQNSSPMSMFAHINVMEATHSAILARIPVGDELSHLSKTLSGFRSPDECMWDSRFIEHQSREALIGCQNARSP